MQLQALALNNVVDPPTGYAPRGPRAARRELYGATTPAERAALGLREQGALEMAKEGWNRQVGELVRVVERADYGALWERAGAVGSRVWERVRRAAG